MKTIIRLWLDDHDRLIQIDAELLDSENHRVGLVVHPVGPFDHEWMEAEGLATKLQELVGQQRLF